MAIGLGFVILGVTTTVITFQLVNRRQNNVNLPSLSAEYQGAEEPLQYDSTIGAELRGVTSDEDPGIYAVTISLGYDPASKTIAFELAARKPEIRDIILTYLSGKTRAELKPGNYRQLQEDLKSIINKVMKQGKIKQVAFQEFVVQ